MFLLPTNEGEKATLNLRVRLFPETTADEVVPSRVHWLFCSEPAVPAVIGPSHPLPASLTIQSVPFAVSYLTEQALRLEFAELICRYALVIFAAPAASEYRALKTCDVAEPVLGVTDTAAGIA